MKKVINLFTIAVLGNLLLTTSCNLNNDDTPVDEIRYAAIETSHQYPFKDYLLLGDGTKLMPSNASLPNGVKSGDLAIVKFVIESEHVVNDTNQFKYTVSVNDAKKQAISSIISSRLDTLGKSTLIDIDSPYTIGDFLMIRFYAYADETHQFYIAKDSVSLAGTPSYSLMRNDTIYLEMRHRGPVNSYNRAYGDMFANLKSALRQTSSVTTDSLTVSIKFFKDNESKPSFKYKRFKPSSGY